METLLYCIFQKVSEYHLCDLHRPERKATQVTWYANI